MWCIKNCFHILILSVTEPQHGTDTLWNIRFRYTTCLYLLQSYRKHTWINEKNIWHRNVLIFGACTVSDCSLLLQSPPSRWYLFSSLAVMYLTEPPSTFISRTMPPLSQQNTYHAYQVIIITVCLHSYGLVHSTFYLQHVMYIYILYVTSTVCRYSKQAKWHRHLFQVIQTWVTTVYQVTQTSRFTVLLLHLRLAISTFAVVRKAMEAKLREFTDPNTLEELAIDWQQWRVAESIVF